MNRFTAGLICGWIMYLSHDIASELVHPGLPTLAHAILGRLNLI